MISWISLFVGLVLGFVIGALATNKNRLRSKWDNLLYKWMEDLEMGDFLHASFSIGKESDDDDEDDNEDSIPDTPLSGKHRHQYRLN